MIAFLTILCLVAWLAYGLVMWFVCAINRPSRAEDDAQAQKLAENRMKRIRAAVEAKGKG